MYVIHKSKAWQLTLTGWLKWNTDVFRIEKNQTMTVKYVYRDSMRCLLSATSKRIADHNVLMAETLVIREAVVNIIQKQMVQVVIESDLLVNIRAINGEINPPTPIRDLVDDTNILAQVVKSIKFV